MKFRMTYDRYTRHEADSFFQEPGEQVCRYRLQGGELLHSQIWPLIWENSVGVDQAAVWRFTQDEVPLLEEPRWSCAPSSLAWHVPCEPWRSQGTGPGDGREPDCGG
jgi:hypothetical protein